MIFGKFLKNGEKDTAIFQNFPKEIHRIANFESRAYRGPHKSHLFFPSGAYKGSYKPPVFVTRCTATFGNV